MLNHQNRFAHVTDGSRRRAVSHTFSPHTKWFDCLQNWISASSRLYQPLPTIPCPPALPGGMPVSMLDCTLQVTAGSTGSRVRTIPASAKDFKRGDHSPISERLSPTTNMTAVGCAMVGGKCSRFRHAREGGDPVPLSWNGNSTGSPLSRGRRTSNFLPAQHVMPAKAGIQARHFCWTLGFPPFARMTTEVKCRALADVL